MRAVNLLPRDAERSRSGGGRLPVVVGAGGAAAVTALCAFLVFSTSGVIDERRAELALTESAIAAVPSADDSGVATGFVVQERADRVAALSAALSSRIPVDRALHELSYVLPEGVWLTGLIANAPSAADPGAAPGGGAPQSPSSPGGVTIQGATFSHRSVARLLARLAVVPSLENVRLTASALIQPQKTEGSDGQTKAAQPRQRALVTFTVEADLRSGGQQ